MLATRVRLVPCVMAAVLFTALAGCAQSAAESSVSRVSPSPSSQAVAAPTSAMLATARTQGGAGIRLEPPPDGAATVVAADTAWDIAVATVGKASVASSESTTEELALFSNDSFGPIDGPPTFQNVLAWVISLHVSAGVVDTAPMGATATTTGPCVVTIPVDATTGQVLNIYRDCEPAR